MPCRTVRQLRALEQYDVSFASFGEVGRDAAADRATTDDDDATLCGYIHSEQFPSSWNESGAPRRDVIADCSNRSRGCRTQRGERTQARIGGDRTLSHQAIEHDETCVEGHDVGTFVICDEPRSAFEIDKAVADHLAILPCGRKVARQREVVDENGLPLQ